MKALIYILILLLPYIGNSQSAKKLTLKDFTLERIQPDDPHATQHYLLLNNVEENIRLRTVIKPISILASHWSEERVVIVYEGTGGFHFLTGAFKVEGKWILSSYNMKFDSVTGLSSDIITSAKFIDGETLYSEFRIEQIGKKARNQSRIYRISQNRVYKYLPAN